jgi:inorganic pyrophosphatase
MHPWHDVDLGDGLSRPYQCVIEISQGSKLKYELDKDTGLLRLDRFLYSSVHYPANYGFLPRTYCEDGDPLDILVFAQEPVVPLCIMRARPIGVITMTDEKGRDDKVIAVGLDDPDFNHYEHVDQFPTHRLRELKRFLLDYKALEGKTVDVDQLRGRTDAERAIVEASRLYQQTILPSVTARKTA